MIEIITYSSKKLSPTHLGGFYRPYKYLLPALQSRSEKINLSPIRYFRPLSQLFHGKREITSGYIGLGNLTRQGLTLFIRKGDYLFYLERTAGETDDRLIRRI